MTHGNILLHKAPFYSRINDQACYFRERLPLGSSKGHYVIEEIHQAAALIDHNPWTKINVSDPFNHRTSIVIVSLTAVFFRYVILIVRQTGGVVFYYTHAQGIMQ